MAKQLGDVRLFVFGDENGPITAQFKYTVTSTDDASLVKHASLDVNTPAFDVDDIETFFDGYVAVIKSNESIA